jgi:hypothetical protein
MNNTTTSEQGESNPNSFQGLNNKQIALVYYRFLGYQKKLNRFIETGMMPKEIMSPLGAVTAMIPAKPEEVQEFLKSEYFLLCNSIVESLKPIVELIEESDDEIKDLQQIIK